MVDQSELIKLLIQNIEFRLLRIFALKWILLCEEIINAATEAPNIYFRWKIHVVQNKFRCRIVYMPRKIISLQKLLKIERHSNRVKLDIKPFSSIRAILPLILQRRVFTLLAVVQIQLEPTRMYITVHHVHLV